jgi:hypothetical protein
LISLEAGDVLLRPYKDSDRAAFVAILGEPELMQLALNERPFTAIEAEGFIAEYFRSGDRLGYGTVCLKSRPRSPRSWVCYGSRAATDFPCARVPADDARSGGVQSDEFRVGTHPSRQASHAIRA